MSFYNLPDGCKPIHATKQGGAIVPAYMRPDNVVVLHFLMPGDRVSFTVLGPMEQAERHATIKSMADASKPR